MKKTSDFIFALFVFVAGVSAQSPNQNYIVNRTFQSEDGTEYTDQIQYFDGLGRPVQTVQAGNSPNGKDIINYTEYDEAGREYKQWLPVPSNSATGNFVGLSEFTSLANACYGNYEKPYTLSLFEPSPLNRITDQMGAGADWQSPSSPKKISTEYGVNEGDVAYYFVNSNNQLQKGISNYPVGTLLKTVVSDEDGKTSTEYKNKQGQIVMKQSSSNVQTYYVYNDLGLLSYIIPPRAADELTATDLSDDNIKIKQFCFVYKYDERGNCIEKRLPGCESVFMVYDKANRLILSQDGNQRAKTPQQWTVIKYDFLGRMLYTGVVNREITSAEKNEVHNTVIAETYTGSSGFKSTGYSWSGFTLSANDFYPLSVNYYDDYSFLDILPNGSNLNWLTPPTNITQAPSTTSLVFGNKHPNSKGLNTGARTYLLDGSGNYLSSALYYDEKGRVVQSRSTNYLGGYDIVYSSFKFNGELLSKYKTHGINGATSTYRELYTYTYDHAGRPLTTAYSINGATAVVLSDMTASGSYDELGRLRTKKRHNGTDTESFDYNIRNWTTRISSGTFEEKLYYNNCDLSISFIPYFNGNIALSTWTYGSVKNAYAYNYDALNRLNRADGYQVLGYFPFASGNMEEFTYDKQGNILSLNRQKGTTYIDRLQLYYKGNQLDYVNDQSGSQNMVSVKEYQNKSISTSNEFAYDANGNMEKDLDRDIVTIRYNILNLPEIVQFRNGNQIKYLYAAGGQKLRVDYYTCLTTITPIQETQVANLTYTPNEVDKYSDVFIDNMKYRLTNGVGYTDAPQLLTIENPEGYSNLGGQKFYYRRDHLGSIREVWWANRNLTLQKNQYYPSGLLWSEGTGAGVQSRRYNGKIWDEMHGWDETDMGWRGQYPAINSFSSIDRKAEKYVWQSPYCVAVNNTVRYVDLNGEGPPMILINGVEAPGAGWLLDSHLIKSYDFQEYTLVLKNSASKINKNNEKEESAQVKKKSGVGGVSYENFSLARMYFHFQVGGRKPMTINSASLDFSRTSQRQLGLSGMKPRDKKEGNLFRTGINSQSLAFGRLEFTYQGNNQFSITDNVFDFDYQANASFSRNAGTILGGAVNYNVFPSLLLMSPVPTLTPIFFGGPYKVIFNGNVTIPY